ncbi:sirohydrochlorin chelatase [Paenibacillus albiflavus]|uniref:Sirohydrochlorin chelatase n=1 Tax=Paenibacillus albiflavus TaxID=2545760 RepID=A0A4V2WP60_9BACL|nr:sirohydrochlorin chelatase [Paenibacillus albiflavus]TCZ78142.1 sirohydrochlorin chelatase [Paenibacillus albiflavus]
MKAILYIGHGTRSTKGSEEVKDFIQRVIEKINIPIQEISFLELTQPLIREGFERCVNRGATQITVIPLFLLAAGHIKQDIPQTIASLQARYPDVEVQIKDPFGVQKAILDAMAELVSAAAGDLDSQDQLLIVGRGSSDPSIHVDFANIVSGMRERLGIEHVSVCYLAAAEPRFNERLEEIVQIARGKIIVLPYLLFSGLLLAEVNQRVLEWRKRGKPIFHTGPLSNHKSIEEIVIARATSS